jgi:hypothetical protein
VIAEERDQPAAPAQPEEPIDHAAAVRAPVDVVPEGDDGVVPARADRVQDGGQGVRAAVDVPDRDRATRHPPLRLSE